MSFSKLSEILITLVIKIYIATIIYFFQFITVHNNSDQLSDEGRELRALILTTQAAAGWLIAMSIGVVVAEVIAIVLVIVNLQGTQKLVVGILVSKLNNSWLVFNWCRVPTMVGSYLQCSYNTVLPCYWYCMCCIRCCMGTTTRCLWSPWRWHMWLHGCHLLQLMQCKQ